MTWRIPSDGASFRRSLIRKLRNLFGHPIALVGLGYDALSCRTSLTRPNNIGTTCSYDNLLRLLSVLHQKEFVGLEIDQVRQLKQLQEENGGWKILMHCHRIVSMLPFCILRQFSLNFHR